MKTFILAEQVLKIVSTEQKECLYLPVKPEILMKLCWRFLSWIPVLKKAEMLYDKEDEIKFLSPTLLLITLKHH